MDIIQHFVNTAKRAIAARSDGAEIYGAYGYLLDQFLSSAVNQLTDKWGGSIKNRARLDLEMANAVVATVRAEQVFLPLSPYASFQGVEKDDVYELYSYIIDELKKMDAKFPYLSLVEAVSGPMVIFQGKDSGPPRRVDFILEY